MSVLVYTESENGSFKKIAHEAVSYAKGIADAMEISKLTVSNIKQNLFGAFVYNSIGIPLAAGVLFPVFGWLLNPAFAGAAMAMSSVSVVSNSLLLKRWRPRG